MPFGFHAPTAPAGTVKTLTAIAILGDTKYERDLSPIFHLDILNSNIFPSPLTESSLRIWAQRISVGTEIKKGR
jgi:hypothetical protein